MMLIALIGLSMLLVLALAIAFCLGMAIADEARVKAYKPRHRF